MLRLIALVLCFWSGVGFAHGMGDFSGEYATLGKNCTEWHPKSTYYALRAGAVDRIDVFTCMAFGEAP